jgi:hypothetical protein
MPAPANDNFANVETLSTSLPNSLTGLTTFDATQEGSEPELGAGDSDQSIWFKFTAPASGWYVFRIPVSSLSYNGTHTASWGEINIAVFQSSVDTLAEAISAAVIDEDEGFTDPGWQNVHDPVAIVELTSGQTYYIKIWSDVFSTANKATCDFDLEWDEAQTAANADFANRQTISGASGSEDVWCGVTSIEVDEPVAVYWDRGFFGSDATVWYEWTCPSSGWYQFELEEKTTDVLTSQALAIYTGSALNALTPVAKNQVGSESDIAVENGQTKIRFNATNGVVYKIQIAANDQSVIAHNAELELRWATASAPTGDTGAAAIDGGFGTSRIDNLGNTDNDPPPDGVDRLDGHDNWWYTDGAIGRSKWFKQTITETGTLRIEASSFADDIHFTYMEYGIFVYKGASFGSLTNATAQSSIDAVMLGYQGADEGFSFSGIGRALNGDVYLDIPVTAGDVVWLCFATLYDKDINGESTQTAFAEDAPQGEIDLKFGDSGVPEDPPENDDLLTLPFTHDYYFQRSEWGAYWVETEAGQREGHTFNATTETDEPAHAAFGPTRSAWYVLSIWEELFGTYKIWVESDVDCVLAVYEMPFSFNSMDDLILVDEDDDSGTGNWPEVSIPFGGLGGTTNYAIAVDSKTEGFFTIKFQKVTGGTPPANDNFEDAEEITSLPAVITGETYDASAEPGEREAEVLSYGPKDTVWYKYVAPVDGQIQIYATVPTNANDDAYVAVDVWRGTVLEELVRATEPVNLNKGLFSYFDSPQELKDQALTVSVVDGETYYIRVQTESGGSEEFTLYVDVETIYLDIQPSGADVGPFTDEAEVYLDLQASGVEVFNPQIKIDAETVPLTITPGAAWETHGHEWTDNETVLLDIQVLGGECYSRFHFTGEGEADTRWATASVLCRWSGDEQVRWTSVIEVQPGC